MTTLIVGDDSEFILQIFDLVNPVLVVTKSAMNKQQSDRTVARPSIVKIAGSKLNRGHRPPPFRMSDHRHRPGEIAAHADKMETIQGTSRGATGFRFATCSGCLQHKAPKGDAGGKPLDGGAGNYLIAWI
jgi:hypothetical protein